MGRMLHRLLAGVGLDRIATAARQTFADLEHWLFAPTTAHRTLDRIEVEQERRGRELLRQMLQAHIQHMSRERFEKTLVFRAGDSGISA